MGTVLDLSPAGVEHLRRRGTHNRSETKTDIFGYAQPTSAQQTTALMNIVGRGEQRVSFVRAIAAGLTNFYEELSLSDFTYAAGVLRSAALNPKNSPATRIGAVEASISVVRNCVRMMPKLIQARKFDLLDKLERHLQAYMAAWNPGDFAQLAVSLRDVLRGKKTYDEYRLRAARTLIVSTLKTMEMVLTLQDDITAEQRVRVKPDDPRLAEAEREARAMCELEETTDWSLKGNGDAKEDGAQTEGDREEEGLQ